MPTYEVEAPDGKTLKPWEMDLEVVNENSTNSNTLMPWERDYSITQEYSPPLKTVKDDYVIETAIGSIIFLTIIFVLFIKSALKKDEQKEEMPIDGITIIVRFIGLFLAMAYEYFKQELKKEGLYIGGFINAGAYMFFVYLVVWYRHKPKTINKEKPIKKPKKQKENKISKTQYFLALIYIFGEWICKKLQKPYQFIKLHFIEICLAIIALSLLKIAF